MYNTIVCDFRRRKERQTRRDNNNSYEKDTNTQRSRVFIRARADGAVRGDDGKRRFRRVHDSRAGIHSEP